MNFCPCSHCWHITSCLVRLCPGPPSMPMSLCPPPSHPSSVPPSALSQGGEQGPHPAPWLGPPPAADGRETPTHLAELGFAASLSSDPAPSASPTCICFKRCLPLALGHLNPLEAGGEGESEAVSLRGGGFWGPALWPCQEVLYWDEGGTERRAHHKGHRLSPGPPQPRSPPSPQSPPSPGVQQGWAKPPGWFWLGGSPAVPSGAGSGRCRLLHPAGPQLTGSPGAVGLCGVPGAAPGPAPGGRTLAAGVADSAFGPRRSFCLSSAGLRTQFAAEKGPGGAGGGPLLPRSRPEPAVCPHSPARPRRMTACPSAAGRLPASPTAPLRTPSPSALR